MRTSLPGHFRLSAPKILDLIRDVELQKHGAVIFYVPDVHDLSSFCFPIDPASPHQEIDIERLSDDQISLFEVFINRDTRPILFPEYKDEVEENEEALRTLAEFAYSKAELIKEFVDTIEQPPTSADPAETISLVEKHLNVAIAVVTGIYSIGLSRWSDVVNRRLVRESQFQSLGYDPVFIEAFQSYKTTSLFSDIYFMLADLIRVQVPISNQRQRRLRAAENDARVVDKIIFVNKFLEQAFVQGRLGQRQILVYFASAHRTARMFQLAAVKNALPIIDGHQYSPWRDKNQIFASLVLSKGRARSDGGLNSLEHNLRAFLQLRLTSGTSLYGQGARPCANCVIIGGTGENCASREFCELSPQSLTDSVRENENALSNVGLLANIDQYSKFMKQRSELKGAEDIREFVANLIRNRTIRDLTLERLWSLQYGLFLKSALLQTVGSEPASDVITSASQVFPIALRGVDPRYCELVELLVEYFRTPRSLRDARTAVMWKIYLRFNELDRGAERFNPEHELVRLLIYLGIEDGAKKGVSLEHARAIRERLEGNAHDKRWDQEFAYVMTWVLRLHGRNHECDRFVKESLAEYPEDARLHHGLLLNAYQWYEEEHSHFSVPELAQLAANARDKYLEASTDLRSSLTSSKLVDELIAVTINDLAFINCFDSDIHNLAMARELMGQVSHYVARAEWPVRYPEYLHTEAMLLFREASVEKSIEKLDAAGAILASIESRLNTVKATELRSQIIALRSELIENE